MEEATLVCWKAAAGEMVNKEQIVLVLETDKVTFEMPSPGDGCCTRSRSRQPDRGE